MNFLHSRREYARIVEVKNISTTVVEECIAGQFTNDKSVNERLVEFIRHADVHYRRPVGLTTTEPEVYRRTARILKSLYGHKPATELFEGQLPFKNGGYLITAPWSTQTEIPGVFAAGDVSDDIYRQAVTAAGMGCMAAHEAEKYLHARTSEQRQAAE